METNPMQRANCQPKPLRQCRRCHARTRSGSPCQSPAVSDRQRCRMHDGAHGSGAPTGKRNIAWRHGGASLETRAHVRQLKAWLAIVNQTIE